MFTEKWVSTIDSLLINRQRCLCVGALLIVLAWGAMTALWWFPRYYPSGDGGTYLVLAKSIAEGKGYRDLRFPDEPLSAHFPPAWPLVLAPIYKVFGTTSIAYHAFVSLLFLASALAVFKLGIGIVGWMGAGIASLGFLFNPLLCEFSQSTLTEIPFALVLIGFFLAAQRAQLRNTRADWLVVIGLAVFAPLLRFTAEVLPVILLIYLLVQRHWYLVLWLLVAFLAKLSIQYVAHGSAMLTEGYFATDFALTRNLVAHLAPVAELQSSPHGSPALGGLGNTLMINAQRLVLTFIPLNLMPSLYHLRSMDLLKMVCCTGASIIVGAGAVLVASKRNAIMVASVAALVLAVLTRENSIAAYRYYAPLAPFLLLFAWTGLAAAGSKVVTRLRIPRIWAKGAVVIIIAAFVVDNIAYNIQGLNKERYRQNPALVTQYIKIMDCLGKKLPQGTVLCAPASASTYLFSGHKTIPFLWRGTTVEESMGIFEASKAEILVLPGWWREFEGKSTEREAYLASNAFDVVGAEGSLWAGTQLIFRSDAPYASAVKAGIVNCISKDSIVSNPAASGLTK